MVDISFIELIEGFYNYNYNQFNLIADCLDQIISNIKDLVDNNIDRIYLFRGRIISVSLLNSCSRNVLDINDELICLVNNVNHTLNGLSWSLYKVWTSEDLLKTLVLDFDQNMYNLCSNKYSNICDMSYIIKDKSIIIREQLI